MQVQNKQSTNIELVSGVSKGCENRSCERCCTRKNCFIKQFDGRLGQELSSVMRRPKLLAKGDRLFIEGDRFYSLYLIRSGAFKSYITDETGDRQITGFHFPADILGLDGIESGRYGYEIEALETSSVCVLPFSNFEQISNRNHGGLYRYLVGAICGSVCKKSHLLMVLGRLHAEQRLASFLLDISDKMGDRGGSEREFNLSMARQDIANYLGLAVETVSRLFKLFERKGLISTERRCVCIINRNGLYEILAADHRFSGLRNIT